MYPKKNPSSKDFPQRLKRLYHLVSQGTRTKEKFSQEYENLPGNSDNNDDGCYQNTTEDKMDISIETVGLSKLKNKIIGQLSSEEQQRILIAKALVNDPKLLILNEITTGIVKDTQNKFHALLQQLNKENKLVYYMVLS